MQANQHSRRCLFFAGGLNGSSGAKLFKGGAVVKMLAWPWGPNPIDLKEIQLQVIRQRCVLGLKTWKPSKDPNAVVLCCVGSVVLPRLICGPNLLKGGALETRRSQPQTTTPLLSIHISSIHLFVVHLTFSIVFLNSAPRIM